MQALEPVRRTQDASWNTQWLQFAEASRSPDVSITHYRAGATELIDVDVGDYCIGVGLSSTCNFEHRDDGGQWQRVEARPGLVSLVPPGSRASVRWHGVAEAVNLHIRPGWVFDHDEKHNRLSLPVEPRYGLVDRITAGLVRELLHDNMEHSPFGVALGESLALSAVYRVSAVLLRDRPVIKDSGESRSIAAAVDYIRSHLDADLSLTEISRQAAFPRNVFSFIRAFQRQCGVAPHKYIVEQRLERAKDMLLDPSKAVTDVALACGFSSLSHFSGAFKKRWGISPSHVRAGK